MTPNEEAAAAKTPQAPSPPTWLVRMPSAMAEGGAALLKRAGFQLGKRLGEEMALVRGPVGAHPRQGDAAIVVTWAIPVDHAWPCCPQEMEGFVEKAAQALFRKFGAKNLQALLVGQLNPGSPIRYYRTLASNLRGRALQLFPHLAHGDAEAQAPEKPTLFCLVGREGLFAGIASPREANGFYPGGVKFIAQGRGTISRAGAKLAGALHALTLHRPVPEKGAHWLDLGASPGGMTWELLRRDYRVTAVDRAPLDPQLRREENLTFIREDAVFFRPDPGERFDAMVCDMNGDPERSFEDVARLSAHLKRGGPVVFTLKTPGAGSIDDILRLHRTVVRLAEGAGLREITATHLPYNRQELTLFFERTGTGGR